MVLRSGAARPVNGAQEGLAAKRRREHGGDVLNLSIQLLYVTSIAYGHGAAFSYLSIMR